MSSEQSKPVSYYLMLAAAAITALVLGVVVANHFKPSQKPQAGITSIGGPFTLNSSAGAVSLKDFEGKVVVVYFGYASCPDVCPTSLGILASAIRSLDKEQQDLIQPIFISVDPERDTPQVLETYVKSFHPSMIGVTGTKDQIDDVTWRYRLLYKLVPMEGSAMGYSVDHASIIFIIGKNGIIQSMAQHGSTPAEVAAKLSAALDI